MVLWPEIVDAVGIRTNAFEGDSTIANDAYVTASSLFGYAAGLRQMGGSNQVDGRTLHIRGVPSLTAANVQATDLRSAAALILAAMAAPGRSRILELHHLRRGYEDLLGRLASLGAEIRSL